MGRRSIPLASRLGPLLPNVQAVHAVGKNQIKDPTVAKSPLVFPTAQMQSKFHGYATFNNFSDFQEWNNIFNPIIQS